MKAQERTELLRNLRERFDRHPERHPDIAWSRVEERLSRNLKALKSLQAMEATGGEPDVIAGLETGDECVFVDCSPESPTGRRSLCFDRAALDARKENKPKACVLESAREIGITLLTETQYRHLQTLGRFDTKTSSWIDTPPDVRALGGAMFCDCRYGRVWVYHNGAESYYAARAFRGLLRV
jgi:hypothetical protein